jgi:ribosome-binding protein aMBF1 (putative translation factor)
VATVEVTVCDVCGQIGRPVQPYSVSDEQQTVRVQLCDTDATPLRDLLSGRPTGPRKPRARRRTRVSTVEEIEALKTQKNRPTADS